MVTTIVMGAVHWGMWAAGEFGLKTAIIGAGKWAINYGAWLLLA